MMSDSMQAALLGEKLGPTLASRRQAVRMTPIGGIVLLLVGITVVTFLVWSRDWDLLLFSLVVFGVGARVLWRQGEFPILLYVFLAQWLEASLATLLSGFEGIPINEVFLSPGDVRNATFLSLLAVLVLALGMRLGAGPVRPTALARADGFLRRLPALSLLYWYVGIYAVSFIAELAARSAGGWSQPLLVIGYVRWAAWVIFTYAMFRRSGYKTLWLVVFVCTLLLNFGTFFSTFKFVFIYGFIAMVAANFRVTRGGALAIGALVALALFLGVIWTSIKSDYRSFVTQGQSTQQVLTGYSDNLVFTFERAMNVTGDEMSSSIRQLVVRMATVDMFAAVLDMVPNYREHTSGELLVEALMRPLMPRLFFPEKTAIDESALTNEFTGLRVAGIEEGTQISIGYIGESYIDFGPILMFVPIFVLGISYGWIYRRVALECDQSLKVIGGGMSCIILVPVAMVGISLAKLIASVVVSVLVVWLVMSVVKHTVRL